MIIIDAETCLDGLASNYHRLHTKKCQPTWPLTLVPSDKKARANSMLLNSTDFGLAIGSVGIRFLEKIVGYGMTFSYSAAFIIIILLMYLIESKQTDKKIIAKSKE